MVTPNGHACIFDMDGVLLDSGAWHRAAWDALLRELGEVPPQPDYWRLTIGRPSEEAIPLLLGRHVPDWETYQPRPPQARPLRAPLAPGPAGGRRRR